MKYGISSKYRRPSWASDAICPMNRERLLTVCLMNEKWSSSPGSQTATGSAAANRRRRSTRVRIRITATSSSTGSTGVRMNSWTTPFHRTMAGCRDGVAGQRHDRRVRPQGSEGVQQLLNAGRPKVHDEESGRTGLETRRAFGSRGGPLHPVTQPSRPASRAGSGSVRPSTISMCSWIGSMASADRLAVVERPVDDPRAGPSPGPAGEGLSFVSVKDPAHTVPLGPHLSQPVRERFAMVRGFAPELCFDAFHLLLEAVKVFGDPSDGHDCSGVSRVRCRRHDRRSVPAACSARRCRKRPYALWSGVSRRLEWVRLAPAPEGRERTKFLNFHAAAGRKYSDFPETAGPCPEPVLPLNGRGK